MTNLKNIDYSKIKRALTAQIPVMELSGAEQVVYFEKFTASMWEEPSAEDDAAFAEYVSKH